MCCGMTRRIALVAGLGLLLAALAFSFAPASAGVAECGWWGSPEWTEAESRDIAERAAAVPGGEGLAISTARAYRDCADTLSARRNVSLGLAASALLVPGAVLFVGRRKGSQTATL